MKLSKRLINTIFGIAVSVLLLLIVLTYQRVTTFQNYANFVSHSLAVQNDILAMRSSYRSLIANQRSFLLTKEKQYFEDFQEEKDSLRHTLDHFAKLTVQNKIHQNYLKRLEQNVNTRIQSLLVEVINDSSSAKYKFAQKELIARNHELNQDFSKTVNALYTYERKLMNQQLELKKSQERLTPFLMLLTALIALGFIWYSFLLISRELKKRQEIEALLKENIDDLNKSNRELEQYAYVASHDLQEPLRKIRTFSDKLLRSYADTLPQEGRDILSRIDKSSARMTSLINDLLSLSRLLSDKSDFKKVDLNEVLESEIDSFAEQIATDGIAIDAAPLPMVSGSEGQLRQLFNNLLSNAIKFKRQEIPLVIVINYSVIKKWEGDVEYKYHQITMRDNGMGFDNAYKEKMFTIFGRLIGTQHVKGTGIGLSICSRIMQNHEGFLMADGIINQGATFTILFPFTMNEN